MGGSQALLHHLHMTSRRSVDQPIQPERAEQFDPEPCWIPEDALQAAFPTGQRMRQEAKQGAV
eukprot:12926706-Prorocentrum_lima.AAC.1